MNRIVDAALITSTGKLEKLPEPTLPEVAFAGRSNVGKSSLLNALCNRKGLFKVSSTPGRTRTIVHAEARLASGQKLYLVDLPGYGYARVVREAKASWAEFMQGYLSTRATLHLVVILVDVRRGPEEEEAQLVAFLRERGLPVLLAATRIDRLPRNQRKPALQTLRQKVGADVIGTSATERMGLDELLDTIIERLHL